MSGTKNRHRKPKYVNAYLDRHGKERAYFRRPGCRQIPLPVPMYSDEFWSAYHAARDGAGERVAHERTVEKGSVDDVLLKYFRSVSFLGLSAITQKGHRRILEKFAQQNGTKRLVALEARHLSSMMADKVETPGGANSWLKIITRFLEYAVDGGFIPHNPARSLKKAKYRTEGYYTWSEDDIAKFEASHPIGSKARLALALLLYTAQRRSDVVRLGLDSIDGDCIVVVQSKTGVRVDIPIHNNLRAAIAAYDCPGDTFMANQNGSPTTPASFGGAFKDWCRQAGVDDRCSAHGLRKAASRRLAEAGCTPHQIMAITGHKTLQEVSRYTAAASRKGLAREAMQSISDRSAPTHFVYVYRHDDRVIYIGQGVASRPLAHLGRPDFPPAEELRIEIVPVASKDAALALEQNLIARHDAGQLLNRITYQYPTTKPLVIEHHA